MKKTQVGHELVFEKYDYWTPSDPRSVYVSGLYAHGKLQDILKHDTIRVYSGMGGFLHQLIFREAVVTKCFVKHRDELLECTLFFWVVGDRVRGLVVLNEDSKYMEDAQLKYKERREHL